ncbi:phage portal protein [Luteimonas sp. e5]
MSWWPFKREKREASTDPSWAHMQALVPDATMSGRWIGPDNAESLATVYACVQAIAETVASLPLLVYRRAADGGRERAPEHPLYSILHDAPNGNQTSLEFREQMQAAVLLHGNAYAAIDWAGDGTVRSLTPLHPRTVTVVKLGNGRHAYDVANEDGKAKRLLAEEVLHLKDRSENGLTGRSRITVARESLGLAMAQQEHGARTFTTGTRLSGVLETPHVMTTDQLDRIRESWQGQFGGQSNAGKTAILENGLSYRQMSMSLEDAEWLASMQFSVEQVCRIFRVPPTMVGDLRHGNYSNTSELARHFVVHSLRRHLVMWEQALSRALMGPIARSRYLIEHNAEGLLRGDSNHRAEFYKSGIDAGWLLPSEARRLENLPVIEGIDHGRPAS